MYNSVTALDICGDYMVAGYLRGYVILWDLNTGTAIKKHFDFKTPVDHVLFLHDKMHFLASSAGQLKTYGISKVLFSLYSDVKTIMDGTFGFLRHVAVLPTPQAPHPVNDYLIVAVATDREVMIVTLKPVMRVLFRVAKPPDVQHNALPYVCWRRVLSPMTMGSMFKFFVNILQPRKQH